MSPGNANVGKEHGKWQQSILLYIKLKVIADRKLIGKLIFYPVQASFYQEGLVYQENIGTHQEVKKAHRPPWGAIGLLAGAGDGHYGANAKVYVSPWVHVLRNRGHLSSTLGRKPLGLQWLRRGFFFPKPFSSVENLSTTLCRAPSMMVLKNQNYYQ